MHPKRKQRLIVALVIVVLSSVTIGLITYALRGNINLFYSPSEVAAGEAPIDRQIRVGGMVVEGSIQRASDRLETRFDVTDFVHSVTVTYNGILPDLFAEGEGVVATGKLGANGVVTASEVLAKHDENYMPPEVAEALEKANAKGVCSDSRSRPDSTYHCTVLIRTAGYGPDGGGVARTAMGDEFGAESCCWSLRFSLNCVCLFDSRFFAG